MKERLDIIEERYNYLEQELLKPEVYNDYKCCGSNVISNNYDYEDLSITDEEKKYYKKHMIILPFILRFF